MWDESCPGNSIKVFFVTVPLHWINDFSVGLCVTTVLGNFLCSALFQSVELDQLAIYLDSDISPWYISKPWENLHPSEWVQVSYFQYFCYISFRNYLVLLYVYLGSVNDIYFQVSMELQVFRFGTKDGKPSDSIMKKHSYVLQPVTGNAKYSKLRSNESVNGGQPLQKAEVNLDDVTLCLSKVFTGLLHHVCFCSESSRIMRFFIKLSLCFAGWIQGYFKIS